MSDYPMLISNKLHSFRNFTLQRNLLSLRALIPNSAAMESVAISDFDCNTLSQYSALGFIASIACVLATFCIRSDTFCFCSVFRAVSKRIILSGFRITCSIVSNVIYAPCLRMDGNTSDVTHLRNGFALSESLRITTSYNPLSVTNVACCPFLNPKSNLAFKSSSIDSLQPLG